MKHTIEDLSIANWIVTTHSDKSMNHRFVDVIWSLSVIQYFDALYDIARYIHQSVKDWQMAVKGAWQVAKDYSVIIGISKVSEAKKAKKHQRMNRQRKPVLKARYARNPEEKSSQKVRSSKHVRSMKCQQIADRLQSITI